MWIRRVGIRDKSHGIILPVNVCRELGIVSGDYVQILLVRGKRIVITKYNPALLSDREMRDLQEEPEIHG